MFSELLQYAHNHWQDNVIASALWAVPGYFWGRRHVRNLHQHLNEQSAKMNLMHKHIREVHSKVVK